MAKREKANKNERQNGGNIDGKAKERLKKNIQKMKIRVRNYFLTFKLKVYIKFTESKPLRQ